MKDSGIPWVGEIPIDWELRRGKYLLREKKEKSETGLGEPLSMSQKLGLVPTTVLGSIPHGASSFVGARLVEPNDLVFNKLKAHLGVFSVSKYRGLVSPDYAVYRAMSTADVRFLEYVFKTPGCIAEFTKRATGVGQGLTRLYTSQLFDIKYPYPCVDEQHRISDYLDERCAAIDEVRRTIEDEVEALRRLRKATIHRAVTKGLDEGVPMRDSGVEWIGEIPEDWDMVPNYAVFSDFKEGVGGRSDEYTLLSLTKQGVIVRDMDAGGKFPSSFDTYQVVYPGQMIFCLFDIDETPRTVGLSENKGMITGAYDVFNVRESVCEARFALYWYLTVDEGKHLRPYYRSLRKTLTSTMFRHVKMPLPPLNEQRRISDYLDERCAAIDSVIDTRTQQLQRLDDYRRALIFAYVTGKKEVPSHE